MKFKKKSNYIKKKKTILKLEKWQWYPTIINKIYNLNSTPLISFEFYTEVKFVKFKYFTNVKNVLYYLIHKYLPYKQEA